MELLKRVADKTVAEKYEIPDLVFDFFEMSDGLGMCVKDHYIQMAEKYNRIDMRYDSFDWQAGVGWFGLLKANQILNEDRYMAFLKEWVDYHLAKGLPRITVNSTVPFYTVLQLYKRYGDPQYRELCERVAKFCMSQALRADEGALEHTVIGIDSRFASQIWADTVFMAGIYLAEWGSFTGDRMYADEAVRQILLHYKYLTDPDNNLMFHAYNCHLRNHMSGVHWGRANGWGIISSVEVLERVPEYMDGREAVKNNLQKHVDAMKKFQAQNGGWHTALDDESTYMETTVACAVYYGVKKALRAGYIQGDYADMLSRAQQYICAQVSPDGEALGTSAGTPIMASVGEYNKIPVAMSYYGQGLMLMALSEMQ